LILTQGAIGMSFEIEHAIWIKGHLNQRNGERKDALKRGHGFGNLMFVEKIWWSLLGHFDGLHPEYEVMDWRGRSYFVDFVWRVRGKRFAFEIVDYGSHGKDRSKYRLDLNRTLFLQSQQYEVISISLDEMRENPSFIEAMLRNILAPYLASPTKLNAMTTRPFCKIERQLMHFAILHNRILRPSDAARELELHKQTVIKYCRMLVQKNKFRPVPTGTTGKIYHYEYIGSIHSPDLF
jgi:very-short-patch-repair endonuclease